MVESLGWVLPIDDHSFRIYVVGRVKEKGELVKMRSRLNGKLWEHLTEEEHQKFPGDYEAMVSQGAIAKAVLTAYRALPASARGAMKSARLRLGRFTPSTTGRSVCRRSGFQRSATWLRPSSV